MAEIESAFSRVKRRPGAPVAAARWANQKTEILPKAITHNLLLRAAGIST